MKLWTLATLCTASLLILSGCSATPKPKDDTVIDKTLPTIKLTKSGVFADANAIAFEWKSIKDPRVNGIYIYKKSPSKDSIEKGYVYYDTINNRFATHYVDTDIQANTQYSYAFKTFSKDAESLLTKAIHVKSLPVLESVSWIYSVNGMPRSAKVIWRPHNSQKVQSYIIERKSSTDKEFKEVSRIKGRLNVEYIDTNLKDNKVYEYRVKVLTFDNLISKPSKTVSVITKALPVAIKNVTATTKLPKKISLKWSKTISEDFTHYHVYRADQRDGNYKLIAKLKNNFFTDKLSEDGKTYYYRVSAVDKDGLESENEETTTMGSSLGKPRAPISIKATLIGNKIEITWSNIDERTKKYIIIKKEKTSWYQEKETQFKTNGAQKYIDLYFRPDTTYVYKVYGVDANSIVSNPSAEVEITTPESKIFIAPKAVQKTESIAAPQQENIQVQGETIIPNKDLNLNEL
jgi:uncharacterized protein